MNTTTYMYINWQFLRFTHLFKHCIKFCFYSFSIFGNTCRSRFHWRFTLYRCD
jgi:hypothetical protein